jgi:hypothetical protein
MAQQSPTVTNCKPWGNTRTCHQHGTEVPQHAHWCHEVAPRHASRRAIGRVAGKPEVIPGRLATPIVSPLENLLMGLIAIPISRLVVPNPFGIRSGTQLQLERGEFA